MKPDCTVPALRPAEEEMSKNLDTWQQLLTRWRLVRQHSVANHIFNCLNNFRVDYLPLVEEKGSTLDMVRCVDVESW